ncbi:hypothetical protein BDQ17DRAFT_1427567 [Cyathus striatus]|nr:hypothetical protein BDQ17DRAFT_1427567 [Cyathus striatus]
MSQFVHNLELIINSIGDVGECDKIGYLWHGFHIPIQQQLWLEKLNPGTSSWEDIVDEAIIIEISQNTSSNQRGSLSLHTGNHNSYPPPPPHGNGGRNSAPMHPHLAQGNRNGNNMPHDHRNNYPLHSSNSNYCPNQGSSNQNRSGFQGQPNSNNSHSHNQNRNAPSDKECTELMAAGKCFRCREPGHLSCNCPQGSNVRANGPRPPSISTFNIEPEGTEGIIDIGDTIEILDSLPFLAISLEDGYTSVRPTYDLDTYWYEYNPDIVARSSIGDSYALVAESILNAFHPYPGMILICLEF